jgi:hypothetical protein
MGWGFPPGMRDDSMFLPGPGGGLLPARSVSIPMGRSSGARGIEVAPQWCRLGLRGMASGFALTRRERDLLLLMRRRCVGPSLIPGLALHREEPRSSDKRFQIDLRLNLHISDAGRGG